jgi:hypothetical protein
VIDPALRPEGWAPKPGSRVVILPATQAAADEPPPPPGIWHVIDRAPEATCWWVMPDDGDAKVWADDPARGAHRDAGRLARSAGQLPAPVPRLTGPAGAARDAGMTLDQLGRRLLPWVTVTVGDFHGYLVAWCDVLGVAPGRERIEHSSRPDSDDSVTVEKWTSHGV